MLCSVVALSLIVLIITTSFMPFSIQNEAKVDYSSNAKIVTETKDLRHKAKTPESFKDFSPVIT